LLRFHLLEHATTTSFFRRLHWQAVTCTTGRFLHRVNSLPGLHPSTLVVSHSPTRPKSITSPQLLYAAVDQPRRTLDFPKHPSRSQLSASNSNQLTPCHTMTPEAPHRVHFCEILGGDYAGSPAKLSAVYAERAASLGCATLDLSSVGPGGERPRRRCTPYQRTGAQKAHDQGRQLAAWTGLVAESSAGDSNFDQSTQATEQKCGPDA
jgi:hypothetical protein